ncbi:MAG: glycosyl hydrolase family 18 protein [Clostridium sp.]
MKKKILKLITAFTLGLTLLATQSPSFSKAETNEQLCVGYYPYYGNFSSIDAKSLTHLNFAFGYIYHNETLPRPGMYDPSKTSDENLIGTLYIMPQVDTALRKIPELKKQNPNLRTLLSIGGWGGRGFCDASATKESRMTLAYSIKYTLEKYGLDGVDIDWECPVNGGWGEIKGCQNDKEHYTLLAQDLREVLGKDKLITIASGPGWDYRVNGIDFPQISKSLDFINIMTYGYSYGGPKYDASLYKTSNDPSGLSTDYFMDLCVQTGVPKEKLIMGTPFYGKIPTGNSGTPNYISRDVLNKLGLNTSVDYGYAYYDIVKLKEKPGVIEKWDDEAKAPYLVYKDPETNQESFIMSYDNAKTQLLKGRYAKEKGFGGVMIWDVSQDSKGDLINSLYNGLYTNFSTNKTPDLNDDKIIDMVDLATLGKEYNAKTQSKCDLNDDNIVDLYDLTLLSRTFSRFY